MNVHVGTCTCVCVPVCRPESKLGCHSSCVTFNFIHIVFNWLWLPFKGEGKRGGGSLTSLIHQSIQQAAASLSGSLSCPSLGLTHQLSLAMEAATMTWQRAETTSGQGRDREAAPRKDLEWLKSPCTPINLSTDAAATTTTIQIRSNQTQ